MGITLNYEGVCVCWSDAEYRRLKQARLLREKRLGATERQRLVLENFNKTMSCKEMAKLFGLRPKIMSQFVNRLRKKGYEIPNGREL